MQRIELEPGLLQVFRLYAWLQLFSLVFSVTLSVVRHWDLDPLPLARPSDFWWAYFVMIAMALLLLSYLYWPALPGRLGGFFFPAGLVISVTILLMGQHLSGSQRSFWQAYPFFSILLILVAWQYRFGIVVFFTAAIMLAESLLSWLFPRLYVIPLPPFLDEEHVDILLFMFISSSIVTFLLLGYVVTRLVEAQRRQRQALAEANQKLISHAATLEQLTTSRERIRLSRELHDTLAHTLSAQAVQLEALLSISDAFPPKARLILEQMQTATRSGLDETRRALSALRASPLEEMGLAAALSVLAEDFAARYKLALDLDIPDHLDDLPEDVEQCFYRVAQETLENVARHAGARQLAVSIAWQAGRLSLSISDDGKGFEMLHVTSESRLGLVGMRERADLIGARLIIDSQPGKGTKVLLEWEGKR